MEGSEHVAERGLDLGLWTPLQSSSPDMGTALSLSETSVLSGAGALWPSRSFPANAHSTAQGDEPALGLP